MSIASDASLNDDDDNILDDADDEINYYAILNVPKDAPLDEITRAYKQRCLIFHPDRHLNEEDKREAAKVFVLLHQAYETLSDAQLRAAYDAVGARGLRLDGWQLMCRSTNPENIRREYEFLRRLRDNELMLQRVHPTSSLSVRATLAGLFAADPAERYAPAVTGMSVQQAIECPLTAADKIGLSGSVRTRNGSGHCTVGLSHHRNIIAGWRMQNAFQLAPDSAELITTLSRSIGERAHISMTPIIGYGLLTGDHSVGVRSELTLQLRPNWFGLLALNYGMANSSVVTTILKTELNRSKFLARLTVSAAPNAYLEYHVRRPEYDDLHYKLACSLSVGGVAPLLSVDRRLTRYSKVGASIYFSYPSCLLIAKFRLNTSLNSFECQLALCDNPDDVARATVYGLLAPLLLTHVARVVFRRPLARLWRLFNSTVDEDEEVNECRREEAQRIVHLMADNAEKIRREEERRSGLVIVEAQYGQLADDSAERYPIAGDRLVNVTVPLQTLVNDSQLRVFSSKDQLPGFYDPCPGRPKVLRVVYKFRGELHAVTVNDDQPLKIPLRAHLIQT